MKPDTILRQTARRMRRAWRRAGACAQRRLETALDRLEVQHLSLQQARQRLVYGGCLANSSELATLRQECETRLVQLQSTAQDVSNQLAQLGAACPSTKFLLAELRQIEGDFSSLQIDLKQKLVTAETESITLEDIELGPFSIQFSWNKLSTSMDFFCFDIVALQPNPAGADKGVTHPHVRDGKLCAGDATAPIKNALEQGRLADAFNLVRGVLSTYNPRSPFVSIDDWEGISCNECGTGVSNDDSRYCESCDQDYCDNCMSYCEVCDESSCSSCLEKCSVCDKSCCGGCLMKLEGFNRQCCPGCRSTCPACEEIFPSDEESEDSSLCPNCRAQSSAANPSPEALAQDQTNHHPSVESVDATNLENSAQTQAAA